MSMVDIEIRDVPQDVWETLVAAAKERGMTMQQYLLAVLEEEVERIRGRRRRGRGEGQ
jgi:hypothetical protein